ncbi:hypothetical protein [Streptomyces sp. SAJ15]|uniref:DUF7739 domain-containing protein n=1 Tax=Streptomyces sp. SAJ15 TaxID=2011095 RepID=UPI0011862CA6|nr:hypothetical protein [Streptomyces sp. SAJ15]TVL89767.1 hypothetical protein CD790_25560 [Streptomyces sp. SAJ15]
MSWTISNGTTEIRRSYSSIDYLGQQIARVLKGSDWRTVSPLFARRTDCYFDVSPRDAGRMASSLRKAAGHRLMPPDWAKLAAELANAAQCAAASRQPWEWR